MSSARIASAVDSLIGHLVLNNPRDNEDVISARRERCFAIAKGILERFSTLWESFAHRMELTFLQTSECICHSGCQPRLRCYQTRLDEEKPR